MSNHPECRYAWTLRRMALPFPSGLVFCRLAGWQGFFCFPEGSFHSSGVREDEPRPVRRMEILV